MKEANHAGRYILKNQSHSSPAGAESDLNPTAAAPSQTEVTDLNCSSPASKFIVPFPLFSLLIVKASFVLLLMVTHSFAMIIGFQCIGCPQLQTWLVTANSLRVAVPDVTLMFFHPLGGSA